MKKKIPTIEQFRKDVSAIFIDVDLDYDYALDRLKYHLNDTIPDNDPRLTYEIVLQKYRSHIDSWNMRNGEKERRGFVDKSQLNKRKNILDFLDSRLYNIDWSIPSATPLRDTYLFGSLVPQSELLIQLNDFKRLCLKIQQKE